MSNRLDARKRCKPALVKRAFDMFEYRGRLIEIKEKSRTFLIFDACS